MVDSWSLLGILASLLLGGLSGAAAAAVVQARLRAIVLSLRFDLATLEERLYREIKTRASALGVKARKQDEELFETLKAEPAKPPQPWWMQHVHPDLQGKH